MNSKALALGSVVLAALVVSGCNTLSNAAGMRKKTPDGFNVVTKAPLVVPPEFALRPPAAGAELPRELDASRRGRAILFGQDIGQASSAGERALVNAAGATATDPSVRTRVDYDDAEIIRKNTSFVQQVLDFVPLSNSSTDSDGKPLDAEAEQTRLAQIESAESATGGKPVVIERKSRGIKLPGT